MKKFNYVYVTTNQIDGKKYIGEHSTNNLQDHYLGSGKIIKEAFKKYGRQNFSIEILENFETKQEAFDVQEKYIKQFNTLTPNGYNISPRGGITNTWNFEKIIGPRDEKTKRKISNSLIGIKHSKERIENTRKSLLGKTPWNKDKKLSLKQKHRMYGRVPWNKGLNIGPRDEKTKRKISETLRKRN